MATAASPSPALFDPDFLEAVQALSLRIGQAQRGGRLAEQRTSARGQGSEFADYKPYASGDDLRAVDWNVYQRLGRVFVRVFEERQDLPVYFLVDGSASMGVETPSRRDAALRATFALAAIAMSQQDSATLLPFTTTLQAQARGVSGRGNLMRVARQLEALHSEGGTDLVAVLQQFAATRLRRGLLVVVSDFFDPSGVDAVVAALARVPHRVLLVQLVRDYDADPRLHPDLSGELALDDGEPTQAVEVAVDEALLRAYAQVYQHFAAALSEHAARSGAGLLRIDAAADVLPQLVSLFGSGELRL
jgi:uncharacterized protein (DUF58 family)